MSLSGEQRSELSAMEHVLSGDQTLSEVAELFAEPIGQAPEPVDNGHDTAPTRRARVALTVVRIGVLFAAAGLILVAVTAASNLPILVATGIVAWICGATAFVVGATMYANEPWRIGVLLARRRTTPRQPTTRPVDDADGDTSV
ncbi:MAG TPA: hypothetical protein VFW65_05475 [Pseudonocardiaceae bacterium]|nr:hypothetical protein [Pseudonocardiaceae bacterium]